MPPKKKTPAKAQAIPNEIVNRIIEENHAQMVERMGNLHNKFVGYIAEAKLPVNEVITVLAILHKEAVEMASKKYAGR
jgi:hypothetical protein